MESVVVSIRIKSALKTVLEKGGVDVQKEIKAFLDQKASQIEMKEALNRIDKILKHSKPSERGFAVKSIREDRNADH